MPPCLKDWYHSNGNFRAWPFQLNRQDQADTPASKLASDQIRAESFCDEEWREHDHQDLASSESKQLVYRLIMQRNLKILEHWYEELGIEEILPRTSVGEPSAVVIDFFDQRRHRPNTEDKDVVYLTVPVSETGLCVYLMVERVRGFETLNGGMIEYGLSSKAPGAKEMIGKLAAAGFESEVYEGGEYFTCQRTTLVDLSAESASLIFDEVDDWLRSKVEPALAFKVADRLQAAIKRSRKAS